MIVSPKAVAAAGGCPISIAIIIKIERPTASEYAIIEHHKEGCGIKAQREPIRRPTKCPPITFLGLAVIFFGIANTMNAVAPIAAIITACSIVKNKSTKNTVRAARKLWKI
jgi:hypothetical protein